MVSACALSTSILHAGTAKWCVTTCLHLKSVTWFSQLRAYLMCLCVTHIALTVFRLSGSNLQSKVCDLWDVTDTYSFWPKGQGGSIGWSPVRWASWFWKETPHGPICFGATRYQQKNHKPMCFISFETYFIPFGILFYFFWYKIWLFYLLRDAVIKCY